MIETKLLADLAHLEKQTAAEQDARYIQLVLDVANGRITKPEDIHAALMALDRDAAQLQRDLGAYQAVKLDFDTFAQVGDKRLAHVTAEQAARDAEQDAITARIAVDNAQRLSDAAERERLACDLAAHRARANVVDAESAGERLMADPSRLRWLPASFRQLMVRVQQLRQAHRQLDHTAGQLRQQIGEARQRLAVYEQRMRYALSRDYYACVPSLPSDEIRVRQAADTQDVANWRTAADADTRMVLQWTTELSDTSMLLSQCALDLEAARADLGAALISPST